VPETGQRQRRSAWARLILGLCHVPVIGASRKRQLEEHTLEALPQHDGLPLKIRNLIAVMFQTRMMIHSLSVFTLQR
jgi:hypothetical protein